MSVAISVFILILVLTVFIIAIKLMNRCLSGDKATRAAANVLVTVLFAPIFMVCLYFSIISTTILEYHPNRKFDVQSWKDCKDIRFEMADDIINSEILLHKSPDAIKDLLGPDDASDDDHSLRYYMGSEMGGWRISFYYLNVFFQDGLSYEAEVVNVYD